MAMELKHEGETDSAPTGLYEVLQLTPLATGMRELQVLKGKQGINTTQEFVSKVTIENMYPNCLYRDVFCHCGYRLSNKGKLTPSRHEAESPKRVPYGEYASYNKEGISTEHNISPQKEVSSKATTSIHTTPKKKMKLTQYNSSEVGSGETPLLVHCWRCQKDVGPDLFKKRYLLKYVKVFDFTAVAEKVAILESAIKGLFDMTAEDLYRMRTLECGPGAGKQYVEQFDKQHYRSVVMHFHKPSGVEYDVDWEVTYAEGVEWKDYTQLLCQLTMHQHQDNEQDNES